MPPEGGRKEEESIMKQKKSVAQLLIKYTVILLITANKVSRKVSGSGLW